MKIRESMQVRFPREVYVALVEDARAWWYHKQLRKQGNTAEARKRERESFRNNVEQLTETIENGGFLTRGRGGDTLHISPNHRCEGLHPGNVRAIYAAGIPVVDTRTISGDKIVSWAFRGPMPGFKTDRFVPAADDAPYRSLDTVAFVDWCKLAHAQGATLTNC